MKRHLAAILAADVAGYSRIMADDEAATLAALTSCLTEVVEPCVSRHGGRIFKTVGDGFLAEFPSVVEAVGCAGASSGPWRRVTCGPEHCRSCFASACTWAT